MNGTTTSKRGETPTLQGVSQALDVLYVLAESPSSLSPMELAEAVHINRTTIYRILNTFEQYDLVEWDDKRARLGPGLWRMIRAVERNHPIIAAATPVLMKLWEETQESVSLNIRLRDEVIRIMGFESPQTLRVILQMGDKWPLHATARARVVLAYLPDDERREYLRRKLESFTGKTLTDPDELEKRCKETREKKYTISKGEFIDDAGAIASPIFHGTTVVGSIDVAGPLPRLLTQVDPVQVSRAAQRISEIIS